MNSQDRKIDSNVRTIVAEPMTKKSNLKEQQTPLTLTDSQNKRFLYFPALSGPFKHKQGSKCPNTPRVCPCSNQCLPLVKCPNMVNRTNMLAYFQPTYRPTMMARFAPALSKVMVWQTTEHVGNGLHPPIMFSCVLFVKNASALNIFNKC